MVAAVGLCVVVNEDGQDFLANQLLAPPCVQVAVAKAELTECKASVELRQHQDPGAPAISWICRDARAVVSTTAEAFQFVGSHSRSGHQPGNIAAAAHAGEAGMHWRASSWRHTLLYCLSCYQRQ